MIGNYHDRIILTITSESFLKFGAIKFFTVWIRMLFYVN